VFAMLQCVSSTKRLNITFYRAKASVRFDFIQHFKAFSQLLPDTHLLYTESYLAN